MSSCINRQVEASIFGGMLPSIRTRFVGLEWILEIKLHHDVAIVTSIQQRHASKFTFFFFFSLVYTSYMPRVMLRVNYFLHFKKSQDLKVLDFFVKLYSRVLGLVATLDPKLIFIILIITLNLG
jgi:hypothetical protein